MHYSISTVTAPTGLPITVEDAKAQCTVDYDDLDTLLYAYVSTATREVESITGRQLMQATLRLSLDRFPCWTMPVPRPILQSVNAINFIDPSNGDTTLVDPSDYLVDTWSQPGLITPAYGKYWPDARPQLNAVQVVYVAGYADSDDIPETFKQAIRLLVAEYNKNREAGAIKSQDVWATVNNLLAGDRLFNFGYY